LIAADKLTPHKPLSPRGTVRAVDNSFYRLAGTLASKRLVNHRLPYRAYAGWKPTNTPATESGLEFIMERIAALRTRRELARLALVSCSPARCLAS
jgi:hypothetical protein